MTETTRNGQDAGPRPRVLLVDDDPSLLRSVQVGLRKVFAIDTAPDGEAGLRALRENGAYDALIADMRMPGMPGSEFLAKARTLAGDTVRIMLTGESGIDTAVRAVNEGAVFRFLTKPCALADLRKAIDAALQQSNLERLARRATELETVNRAKDAVLSTVSHELRTPLTKIVAAIEILLAVGDGEPLEFQNECLRVIDTESRRLCRLVEQTLELASIETDATIYRIAEHDLRAVVSGTARSSSSPEVLELDLGSEPVPCLLDAERMQKALGHLIDNAIRFSPSGCTVNVVLDRGCGHCDVRVLDRGPGVSGEPEKERIFDCFHQTGDVLTGKPSGLGIGLTFARMVARAHGGDVWCEDRSGGGATFVLRVPLASNKTGGQAQS